MIIGVDAVRDGRVDHRLSFVFPRAKAFRHAIPTKIRIDGSITDDQFATFVFDRSVVRFVIVIVDVALFDVGDA